MIEVENLSKVFHPIVAVDNISFKVGKGEVLGFLGPNGAGKSTTMKIITCFLSPTAGQVKVCGYSVADDPIKVRKSIGYMPENAPLYGDMTVLEFLKFMAELREIDRSKVQDAISRVLKLCALKEVQHQPIDTLSKGYKRRVSMAQALIHDPEILILDEPTDGLDPNQKFEVRKLICQLAKENKCIILSTHILEEVEAACSRAIIISDGKILFDGTANELKGKSKKAKVEDVFRVITTGQHVEGVQL